MTRVLIVWEDTYFQPLDDILNRVVKKLAPSVEVSRPTVLHHTARSNTAFERYVATTWPIASARGLPRDPGAIDHVRMDLSPRAYMESCCAGRRSRCCSRDTIRHLSRSTSTVISPHRRSSSF